MITAKRILLVGGMAMAKPTPTIELGGYIFVDGHPENGDIIEWNDGEQYAVQGRIWNAVGDYSVLVRKVLGYEIPEKETNETQI